MLVIISDLHLTDGHTARNPHESTFRRLGQEIRTSAEARNARELEIVLLGDIFDVVRTDYWHRNGVPAERRPWGGEPDPVTGMNRAAAVEAQFSEILSEVLVQPGSRALIATLQGLEAETGLRPHVTYVPGNHDRVLNNFHGLRRQIADALDPLAVDFANVYESADYGVRARHGHEWDDNCHGWQLFRKVLNSESDLGRFDELAYRVMAIGEVVTAELMSGVIFHMRQALDPDKDRPFLDSLMDLHNLRPMAEAFHWLAWKKQSQYTQVSQQAVVTALDGVLNSEFARLWNRTKRDLIVSGDLTDYLEKVRDEVRLGGLDAVRASMRLLELIGDLRKMFVGERTPLVDGAAEEAGALPDDSPVQYIVYGHSHRSRQDCFSARVDGRIRMYINTGTFLPLIERAHDRSFYQTHRMTFACFFRDGEDTTGRAGGGPAMDMWDRMQRKVPA
jgi:UDP-2,3-diacylglucosamine pyrophosphatase LpxH